MSDRGADGVLVFIVWGGYYWEPTRCSEISAQKSSGGGTGGSFHPAFQAVNAPRGTQDPEHKRRVPRLIAVRGDHRCSALFFLIDEVEIPAFTAIAQRRTTLWNLPSQPVSARDAKNGASSFAIP